MAIIAICCLLFFDNTDVENPLNIEYGITYGATALYCGLAFALLLIGVLAAKSNVFIQKALIWLALANLFIFLFLNAYLDVVQGTGLIAPALGYLVIAVMFSTRFLFMIPMLIMNGFFLTYYMLYVTPISSFDAASLRIGMFGIVLFSILVFVFVERQRRAVYTAREDLATKVDELNRALDVKSTFLGHMSHELRTPLNAIIGFSDILLQGKVAARDNDHLDEYLGHINSGGRHLLRLVNDVLDQSKLEAGEVTVKSEKFEIKKEIQSHLVDLSSLFTLKEQGAFLQEPGILIYIESDPRLLKQIMINLLSNAQKFTPKHGKIEVSVTEEQNDAITIEVSDTGPGMSKEVVGYLNDPNSFSKTHYVREAEGTGLGLIIVRQITQLLGGDIHITSTLGKGTVVSFTLPTQHRNRPLT